MWPQSKMSTSSFLNRLDDLQQRLMAENRSLEDDRRDRNAETGSPSPRRPRMCKILMCRLSFYRSYFWLFSSVILFLFWFHHILFLCTVLHFEQKRMFADDFTIKLIACSSFCSFLISFVSVTSISVNIEIWMLISPSPDPLFLFHIGMGIVPKSVIIWANNNR